jgi:small subunit ribosomal protein S18
MVKPKKTFKRKKICRFCADKIDVADINYKDVHKLRHYATERGKIIPRRISGNCAKHQRALSKAIKRARVVAFMPFTAD